MRNILFMVLQRVYPHERENVWKNSLLGQGKADFASAFIWFSVKLLLRSRHHWRKKHGFIVFFKKIKKILKKSLQRGGGVPIISFLRC
jgi:hypothetical protein